MPNMKIFQDSSSQLRSRIYGLNGTTDVALKVGADGTLAIEGALVATDLDIRDLTSVSDNVQMYGYDGSTVKAITTDGNGVLAIQDNGSSITVDAADLDIRDLTSVSDNVQMYGYDGSTVKAITTDGSGVLAIQDNGSSITVDAADLDIRALTSASDSVTIYREFTTATQTVTTATDYAGSTTRDVSAKQAYSLWVRNTGTTYTADCRLEISPDGTNWLADTSDITVGTSTSSIIVANRYLRYARVAHKSTTAGEDTELEIIWQARS